MCIEYKIKNTIIDKNGNNIILDMTICDKNLTLVSIYGPNSHQPQFYEEVFNNVRKISNEYCIICWDYNLVIYPQLDYYSYKRLNNKRAMMALRSLTCI
jgi:hypothetical protein